MANTEAKILSWNRLEPRPRTEDFDRTLRTEIRDPLWMMTRQLQLGEFQAEDTGSALFSRLNIQSSKMNRIQLGENAPRDVEMNIPMEADVEKEEFEYDFLMCLEMGRYWEKLVTSGILSFYANDLPVAQGYVQSAISDYRSGSTPEDLQFHLPTNNAQNAAFYSNVSLWQSVAAVAEGKAINGKILYDFIQNGHDPFDFLANTPIDSSIISTAQVEFVDWFNRNYVTPNLNDQSAWNPNQLEYQFHASSPKPDTNTGDIFSVDEYYHGKLDWYAFDFDNSDAAPTNLADFDSEQISTDAFTMIPTTISFAGMPHPRWWQMEDSRVDLADISPTTSDVAKLIYSEFGLIFSNDWMIFPYTAKAGTSIEVTDLVVTDCFGQRTLVKSANEGISGDWERWSFFGISNKVENGAEADTRLLLPATVNVQLQSAPVEEVNFIRDEMANIVWGIEKIIPDGMGQGLDAYEQSLKHINFLKEIAPAPAPSSLIANDADIEYKVSNSVPENWIPFVPVSIDPLITSRQIQLRRAALPRYVEGLDVERIRPKTVLLQENAENLGLANEEWNAYHIHEDEVPRSGVQVKKTWQRTRMENGKVVTWLGRRKTNGRGEGNSNLSFDTIEDKL